MKKIITLSILLLVATIATAQIRVGDAVVPYKVNFEGEELIEHKVFKTYMVRKKQGKSQIKHLKSKGKSKSTLAQNCPV